MNEGGSLWIDPPAVDVPQAVRDQIGDPLFLAEALVRRGFTDSQRLQKFLDPALYTPAPPGDLPDLAKAADRIESSIHQGELIGVWGDFDVDGQTATTLLVQTLQTLGANVRYFIPNRERDSHGVALPALATFLDTGIDLVITCDTGISANAAVNFATKRKVDFIITDHHTLPEALPAALAVVNPQRLPPGEALSPLCGVGCAFKLAEELLVRANRSEQADDLLDLVALGTVADLAILTADNRYLVQRGLERLRRSPRPAIEAILELSDSPPAQITEELISFIIAPRLNALGRLDDANPAVSFFLAKSLSEARPMAARLEALNARRKLLCDQVFQAAQAQIQRDRSLLEHPVLMLGHPTWPGGVLGIVASRLTELYLKPVILLANPPGEPARGSARSIEGVNITQAITNAQPLLNSFGGHPMAAGLSLDSAKISEVHYLIDNAVRQQQTQEQTTAVSLVIDAFVSLDQLNLDLVKSLDRMAPFGPGNRALILVSHNLALQSQASFGKSGEHLQLLVEDASGTVQKVVWWQGAGSPLPESRFDLAYTVRSSNYRGKNAVQVEWGGFRIIPESIPMRQQRPLKQILDHRNELDPNDALKPWLAAPDTLIFAEGGNTYPQSSVDRSHLSAAANLVIWSIPPGRDELQAVLDTVAPHQVIWFGVNSGDDQLTPFLTRLTGLVRFAIKSRHGKATILELAAATAQREKTVKAGLAWLAARGFINTEIDEMQVCLSSGGKANADQASQLEKDITYLLGETAAFRNYCQKTDLNLLLL